MINIFVSVDGQRRGPFDTDQLKKEIACKRVNLNHLAWIEGQEGWLEIRNIPSLVEYLLPPLPTSPGSPPPLTRSLSVAKPISPGIQNPKSHDENERWTNLEREVGGSLPDALRIEWSEKAFLAFRDVPNFSLVEAELMHWLLVGPHGGVLHCVHTEEGKEVVRQVAGLLKRILQDDEVAECEWTDASAIVSKANIQAREADAEPKKTIMAEIEKYAPNSTLAGTIATFFNGGVRESRWRDAKDGNFRRETTFGAETATFSLALSVCSNFLPGGGNHAAASACNLAKQAAQYFRQTFAAYMVCEHIDLVDIVKEAGVEATIQQSIQLLKLLHGAKRPNKAL